MVWYTYGTVAVYDPATNEVLENATGGKFRLALGGPDQPIRDVNGTPITSITSNEVGQSSIFQAESLYGVVQFGSIAVTVWANEVAQQLVALQTYMTSITQAVTDAQAAAAAAQAVQVGTVSWDAVLAKPATFPPSVHGHTSGQITDSTTVGRALMVALDAQAARAAIGAGTGNGTSNLTLGSTATTAAPGNHAHPATAITFSPTGTLTATNVQTAIEQAALTGSSTGGGAGDSISWVYASGAYPALPTTKPTGVKVVTAYGPVQPTTLPSWLTTGDPILSYLYRAAS